MFLSSIRMCRLTVAVNRDPHLSGLPRRLFSKKIKDIVTPIFPQFWEVGDAAHEALKAKFLKKETLLLCPLLSPKCTLEECVIVVSGEWRKKEKYDFLKKAADEGRLLLPPFPEEPCDDEKITVDKDS